MEPRELAHEAGLQHVSDEEPGIRRIRRGKGFSYHAPTGELIAEGEVRARIADLAIPPAWTDVWICPDPQGHFQATGRDAQGRKQYRYHAKWIEHTARNKFHRMSAFGRALPRIRRRVRRDLRREGLPREKVLAVLVRMLDLTGIRIGTESSLRANGSYGLTTLRRKHVAFEGEGARLRFRGKGGKTYEVGLSDGRLAGILQECYQAPGYELFQVRDEDGDRHVIGSEEVNEYIQAVSGGDFTARDFRTWVGSTQALEAIECLPPALDEQERQRCWEEVLDVVSRTLHNTPAVCEEFYIHPQIAHAFQSGGLPTKADRKAIPRIRDLRRTEALFLTLLEENEPDSGG